MTGLRCNRGIPRTVTALLATWCLMLCACGDKPEVPVAAAPASLKPKAAPTPAGDLADMVSAVTMSGDAPVNLQFALRAKPRPNEPLEMGFILQPTRDIDSAQVTFEPNSQVEIASDNPFFSIARTAAGAGAVHKLTVVPRQTGMLSMNVIVAVDLPTGSVARSYSIPILVFPDKP